MEMDLKQKITSKQKSIKDKKTLMGNDSKNNTSRTIAYLRVSTISQNLKKNRADILKIAKNKNLSQVQFIEEKVSGKIFCDYSGYLNRFIFLDDKRII